MIKNVPLNVVRLSVKLITFSFDIFQLCTALETANKLVQTTNAHVQTLSEKVEKLQKLISQRDSTVEAAKAIQASL